jgi:hypothetical protein
MCKDVEALLFETPIEPEFLDIAGTGLNGSLWAIVSRYFKRWEIVRLSLDDCYDVRQHAPSVPEFEPGQNDDITLPEVELNVIQTIQPV